MSDTSVPVIKAFRVFVLPPQRILEAPDEEHYSACYDRCDAQIAERASNFCLEIQETSGRRDARTERKSVVEQCRFAHSRTSVFTLEIRNKLYRCVDRRALWDISIVRVSSDHCFVAINEVSVS